MVLKNPRLRSDFFHCHVYSPLLDHTQSLETNFLGFQRDLRAL